jgi:hypothetical protein
MNGFLKKTIIAVFILFSASYFIFEDLIFDRFSFNKIAREECLDENLETIVISDEEKQDVGKIFSQDFTYLGKGRQTFVFVSEDGNYVIKFFNRQRFFLPGWLEVIPLPKILDNYRSVKIEKKLSKLRKFYYNSYILAYKEWKESSGIIFINFSNDNNFNHKIYLKTPLRSKKLLDINKVPFIVQKRAYPIYDSIIKFAKENKEHLALENFFSAIEDRFSRYIGDDDLDVEKNFGFINEQTIAFDAGRLYKDERLKDPAYRKLELKKGTKLFRKWIEKKFPSEIDYFDERIEQIANNI